MSLRHPPCSPGQPVHPTQCACGIETPMPSSSPFTASIPSLPSTQKASGEKKQQYKVPSDCSPCGSVPADGYPIVVPSSGLLRLISGGRQPNCSKAGVWPAGCSAPPRSPLCLQGCTHSCRVSSPCSTLHPNHCCLPQEQPGSITLHSSPSLHPAAATSACGTSPESRWGWLHGAAAPAIPGSTESTALGCLVQSSLPPRAFPAKDRG